MTRSVLEELVAAVGSQRNVAVALDIPGSLLSRYLARQVDVPPAIESHALLLLDAIAKAEGR